MVKTRNFCFSLPHNSAAVALLETISRKYILYAKSSRSEQTGSVIQGVVVFCSPRTLSGVIKSIPGSVVQIAGDIQECISKCKQLGDFTELGVMPLTQHEKGKRKAEMHSLRSVTKRGKHNKEKNTKIQDIQQIEACDTEQQGLLAVSREAIPPLLLSEAACFTPNDWLTYANWILDVLKIPLFNITKYNFKQLTLTVPGSELQYYFNFRSTWLKSSSGHIYFNYKLSTSAMNGCGLHRTQPNEYFKDPNITTFDLQSDISCILFQADCGMGKTQFGLRSLIQKHKAAGHSILLPTENTSLSFFLKEKFPEFSHYRLDKDKGAFKSPLLICQFESLYKLERLYDVTIIDECTSFIMHTASPTMKDRFEYCLAVLGNHLKNSTYLYGVDADILPPVVDLFRKWRSHDPPYLVQYTHKPLSHNNVYLALTKKQLLQSLLHSLQSGDNCVLVLQTIKDGEQLFRYFSDKVASIILINRNGATSLVDGVLKFKDSMQQRDLLLGDPDQHFPFCKLFIYTPSIKTGVSFEKHHFNRLYAIASKKSSTAREFQQGLLRMRNISSNKYILHLGNTFIGDLKAESRNLESIRTQKAANYFLAASKFNPNGLHSLNKTNILKESCFDQPTSDLIALGSWETLQSERHFGVSLIAYLCFERGFSFKYLHQMENGNVMGNDLQNIYFPMDFVTRSWTGADSVEFLKRVLQAPNITTQKSFELIRKEKNHVITDKEQAQLGRYQFKKYLALQDDDDHIITLQFLETYFSWGAYIHKLQCLFPIECSNEGQVKKLSGAHHYFKNIIEKNVQCLEQKGDNEHLSDIQTTAYKTKVHALHIKANAAHSLLHNMGFEWFGDQTKIEGADLDRLWSTKGFKWYKSNIKTARVIFDIAPVRGRIEEESTRKQYLGFINTILFQGIGVKIKSLGKGTVQRNYFCLNFEIPFMIPNTGRCFCDKFQHVQDEDLLVLKPHPLSIFSAH